MLRVIIVFIDSPHHLFSAVINGDKRQLVVWLAFRFTPDSVCILQFPVAERYYDMVKLQSFALVDCYKSDAVHITCLYGLFVDVLIPFFHEIIHVGCVACNEVVQAVIKSVQISVFAFYFVQMENLVKAFSKFKQRQ